MALHSYLCRTEHSATCEGWTVWLSRQLAADSEAAKKAHVKRCGMEPYFAQGTEVIDTVEDEPKARAVLATFFAPDFITFIGSRVYNDPHVPGELFNGFGEDFALSFYVNRS